MKIALKNVVLGGHNLYKPEQYKGEGKAMCNAKFFFAKDSETATQVINGIKKVAEGKWADKAKGVLATLKASDRLCIHDGDLKYDEDSEKYSRYKGMYYVSARNAVVPRLIDRAKRPVSESDGLFVSGCIVDAVVDLYAQASAAYGNRVNASLLGVQFVAAGDSIARIASLDDFQEYESTEDDGLI